MLEGELEYRRGNYDLAFQHLRRSVELGQFNNGGRSLEGQPDGVSEKPEVVAPSYSSRARIGYSSITMANRGDHQRTDGFRFTAEDGPRTIGAEVSRIFDGSRDVIGWKYWKNQNRLCKTIRFDNDDVRMRTLQ